MANLRQSSIVLKSISILTLIQICPVNSRLAPAGCLSYTEKTNIQNLKNETLVKIKAMRPEWCEDPDSRSAHLRNRPAESSRAPFVIHSWNYKVSNAVRVKIRTRKKGDKVNFIQELIIQARPVYLDGNGEMRINLTKRVGAFYIVPHDIQQNCCDLHDLDIARIYRKDSANQTASIGLLWLPNGFYEDYEGTFVFFATISNTLSQYWTQVKSHVQIALPSRKVTDAAAR